MTEAEIAALIAENAKLKAEKETQNSTKKAVNGVFSVKVKREGKEVKETYRFADNQHRIWSDLGNLVPTELIIRLANGETLKAEDITDRNNIREFLTADNKDNGKAIALLTDFAQRGTSILVKQ